MADPKNYFIKQKSLAPALYKDWDNLEDYFEKKLWYQLTLNIESLIKNDYYKKPGALIELYEKCLTDFENRISPLALVKLAIQISSDYKDYENQLKFLKSIKDKVAYNKEADALAIIAIGNLKLHKKNLGETKECIEKANELLDQIDGISSVHSDLYRLSSSYYYEIKDHVQYYKESLKFLGCTDLKDLNDSEKKMYAYNLGIASLLGEDIYNFVELLSHPILDTLKGGDVQWLVDLLYAFNSGDLSQMEKLKPKWTKQPDLKAKEEFLFRKIKLLCLMEMTYKKPANNRQLDFEEISKGAGIPIDQVENLVMKALSLKLVKGYIDEIDKKVYMTWVQPRVLDVTQMVTMNQIIEKWSDEIRGVENVLYQNAKEIIHV